MAAPAAAAVSPDQPHWYVVATNPNSEKLVRMQLRQEGYEVYLPLIDGGLDRRGKPVIKPFIPGHMFVHTPENRCWPIYSTMGVRAILTNDRKKPAAIPERFVTDIVAREVAGLVQMDTPSLAEPGSPFVKGQRVRAEIQTVDKDDRGRARGVLTHTYDAIFEEALDSNRVAILLSFMGRDSRTLLHPSRLSSGADA